MNQETTVAASTVDGDGEQRSTLKSIIPGYIEELVTDHADSRNYKGISIAVGVILLVVGCVALSAFLVMPDVRHPVVPKVSKSDIVDKEWKPPEYHWVGPDLVYTDGQGNVKMASASNKEEEILISKEVMNDNGIVEYKISSDGKYALLGYNKIPIYTYSYSASYYIFNIKTRTKEPLIHNGQETVFQFAGFGRTKNSIIYSLNGDLHFKSTVRTPAIQLTIGGKLGVYQNGLTDWIYEEEILKDNIAHWWSPTGRYLAYATFDDNGVEDAYVTIYNGMNFADVIQYKKMKEYKCPKAGRSNPIVNVHVIDLKTLKIVTFERPALHKKSLDTFHALTWLSDDELLVTWSTRTLMASVMQLCFPTLDMCMDDVMTRFAADGKMKSNAKRGWLTDLNQRAISSADPSIFFCILSSDHGGRGDFRHLAMVNKTAKPSSIKFLTEGSWEVTKLLHYDASKKEIYYISNEQDPGSRHVYRVNMYGKKKCMTCPLSGVNSLIIHQTSEANDIRTTNKNLICNAENKCRYYDASFGTLSNRFSVICLGPCLPYGGFVEMLRGPRSKGDSAADEESFFEPAMQVLTPPTQNLPNLLLPVTNHETIRKDGYEINCKILHPASIHVGKRPVVFFKSDVGSQTATFRFNLDLATYVVSSIGAFGVFVDGKGSSNNGGRLLRSVAERPGILEIEDMKAVLEYLKPIKNVDVSRVGIVGYPGYGGYIAALSLTNQQFSCGVARSPITDWKLYDSFGSEKLLGSPTDNVLLYEKHRLVRLIEGITDSKLRIFHGLQNRKVSMQHSVLLEQAAMLSNLPLDAVRVTFHPTFERILDSDKAKKIESNIYESISVFLGNCLFGSTTDGKAKLELLKTNYGIPT